MANDSDYLRAILALLGRQAFPVKKILAVVGKEKQIQAYNLCDGTRSQAEIVKELTLDPSNFSKLVSRWVEFGIIVKVGESRETKPLHLYPLSDLAIKQAGAE